MRETRTSLAASAAFAFGFTIAAGTLYAQTPSSPVIKPVAYMATYQQPIGLIEETPGVFYIQPSSSNQVVLEVTAQGTQKLIASLDLNVGFSTGILVSGPDNRLFSALNKANAVFSVGASGGTQIYSTLSASPRLTQNLPDGSLLGDAIFIPSQGYGLIKASLDGAITTIAMLPPGDIAASTAIVASDGNYYGIYYTQGGSVSAYRVTPHGSFSVLFNFPASPKALGVPGLVPLLQASDGNLYGAIPEGGANGTGIIYKLTLGGQYTLLRQFPKGAYYIPTSLIEASDGNLYGTTYGFGAVSLLFRITKSGEYTLLSELAPNTIGLCNCLLIQGSDGLIYGTAQGGGATGAGTVFSVDAGLPKPAPRVPSFEPQSGPAGTRVLLWGANLLSPSVQFNGVPATAVVSSGPNYVWATVPEGATSGPIALTTPGGTFTTSASFSVQ